MAKKRARKPATQPRKKPSPKAAKKATKKPTPTPKPTPRPAKRASKPRSSPGGSRIVQHDEPSPQSAEFPPIQLTSAQMTAIEKHITRHIGPFKNVLHEIMSMGIHLDVIPVPPTKKHPFHTFVTMGMSALPMTLPKGCDSHPRAELAVVLPKSWKTDEKSMNQAGGRWFWPIQGLKECARLPSTYDSFLDIGHTIPNGDPPEPFGVGCPFVCWMVMPPLCFGKSADTIRAGRFSAKLRQIIPLHAAEMRFKLQEGPAALYHHFAESDLHPADLCDPERPSVV